MRIETDPKLDFKDVLIRPKRSTLGSRREVELTRELPMKWAGKTWRGVPIIAANMDGVGTLSMARAFHDEGGGLTAALTKHYSVDQLVDFFNSDAAQNAWYSLGISEDDQEKLDSVLNKIDTARIDKLCIDVANGYSERFSGFVKSMRDKYPDKIIMAGNVVTGEMTEELILSGADIAKVGIGPGSVCTTRKMTGVGYPQLSAIIECADAAHGLGGLVCGDGGCTVPGDIAKAFGAGADFVMLGGMLAGHDQCEGDIIESDGKKYCRFYGMSSDTAMERHSGGVAVYRASEGKTVMVEYRGDVKDRTMQDLLGGLRSACTYVGASRLKELSKRTTFVMVGQQINNIFGSGA